MLAKKRKQESDRYHSGVNDGSRMKYAQSEKGKKARKKARENWAKSNPEMILKKDRRARAELKNEYIAKKLKRSGFKKEDITKELLEVKRIIIKTKRLCKTLKNSESL